MAGSAGDWIGKTTNGQVPNITGFINGEVNFLHGTDGSYGGAIYPSDNYTYQIFAEKQTTTNKSRQINFDASRASDFYVDGVTQVRAASLFVAMCIKY